MATWIWFPHDFEIDLRGKVEIRRNAFGMIAPSIWRMDALMRAGEGVLIWKGQHVEISACTGEAVRVRL